MNINRHNYEEYFLLYADNELSAAEKNMVKAFLANNPDLHKEMAMLQGCVIKPAHIVFKDKENLLKPQPIEEGILQQLVLLLDNELPADKKQYIIALTENEEVIKNEWQLLQHTKLSAADTIIFADKASLYKKEQEGKVIPLRWWRVAVAAILIGFGLWGAVSFFNRNTSAVPTETATKNNEIKAADKIPAATTPAKNIDATAAAEKQNKINNTATEKVLSPLEKIKPTPAPQQKNNELVQQKKDNNLPTPGLENLNNNGSNKVAVVNVQPENNVAKVEADIIKETSETKTIPSNVYAVNAAVTSESSKGFTSFDEEEGDRPKKTKLGGFFKKVKRVLERKTNIKTGSDENIKIANMSFAMQ